MSKPKGHKPNCRCAVCKNARKGKKGKAKRKGSGATSKHTAAERRKTKSRLRRELSEAKRGEAAASRLGDAKSWREFKSARKSLEGAIKRA